MLSSTRSILPRLEFEYAPRSQNRSWAPWLLLAIALIYAGDVTRNFFQVRSGLQKARTQLSSMQRLAGNDALPVAYIPHDVDHELAFARNTIDRIALPWNELFHALNGKTENVTLLSVQPDADTGTVQIQAESRDLPAMLTYLSKLSQSHFFTRIDLMHHELQAGRSDQPIAFTITAVWRSEK